MSGAGPDGGERLQEGLDHLQSAVLQAIEAARAFLDVAEELVREPGVVADVARAAAAMAVAVRDEAAGAAGRPGPPPAAPDPSDRPEPSSNVRRIPLS
jgi:hypothetical protein